MPTIRSNDVQVDGLDELYRALRQMGPELEKQMRLTNKAAAETETQNARAAAARLGDVPAHVINSLSSRGSGTAAGIAFGGPRAPDAMGHEFGAGRDMPRKRKSGTYLGYQQFKPWRGRGEGAGYFIYPTIRRDADRIVADYEAAVDRLLKATGLA